MIAFVPLLMKLFTDFSCVLWYLRDMLNVRNRSNHIFSGAKVRFNHVDVGTAKIPGRKVICLEVRARLLNK